MLGADMINDSMSSNDGASEVIVSIKGKAFGIMQCRSSKNYACLTSSLRSGDVVNL